MEANGEGVRRALDDEVNACDTAHHPFKEPVQKRLQHFLFLFIKMLTLNALTDKSGGCSKKKPAYAPAYPASLTAYKQVTAKKTGVIRPAMPNSRTTF